MRLTRFLPFALFLAVGLTGCHGERINRDGVVQGTVTLDGVPLKGGVVLFETADGKLSAQSTINAQGDYAIKEAPLGTVRISVRTSHLKDRPSLQYGQSESGVVVGSPGMVLPDPKEVGLGYTEIPVQYETSETSGLSYNISKGNATHPIVLTKTSP